jgi:hypothetical protein
MCSPGHLRPGIAKNPYLDEALAVQSAIREFGTTKPNWSASAIIVSERGPESLEQAALNSLC